jgi:hypothetical protein
MDTQRMKAILVAVAALIFALSPLATPDFGGFEPDQYPVPQEDPPVQPAGYAFSIWGVIYLWLIIHGGFGLFARAESEAWDRVRWPLIASLGLGASWLAVASVSPPWATVQIWAMLALALLALWRADPRRDPWLLAQPIGLYAGWLTAASLVSIGLLGAGYGVGPGATGWAWIIVIAAIAIGAALQWRFAGVPAFGTAVAWALVGVAVANWDNQMALALTAVLGALGVAATAFSRRAA